MTLGARRYWARSPTPATNPAFRSNKHVNSAETAHRNALGLAAKLVDKYQADKLLGKFSDQPTISELLERNAKGFTSRIFQIELLRLSAGRRTNCSAKPCSVPSASCTALEARRADTLSTVVPGDYFITTIPDFAANCGLSRAANEIIELSSLCIGGGPCRGARGRYYRSSLRFSRRASHGR